MQTVCQGSAKCKNSVASGKKCVDHAKLHQLYCKLTRAKKKGDSDSITSLYLQITTKKQEIANKRTFRSRGSAPTQTRNARSTTELSETQHMMDTLVHETEIASPDGTLVKNRVEMSSAIYNHTHVRRACTHDWQFSELNDAKTEFFTTMDEAAKFTDCAFQQQADCVAERSVYVLRAIGTTFVKIGFSSNVGTRLCQLQTGCPIQMKLEFSWETLDFRTLETWLHEYFASVHIRGEWFAVKKPIDWVPIFRQFFLRNRCQQVAHLKML